MQLVIDTSATSISVKNKSFYIKRHKISRQISPKRISSIAITTNCTINSAAIKLAALNQIPIFFFNNFGTMQARTTSPYFTNIATLRKKQLQFYDLPEATGWIIDLLERKVEEQIITLIRLSNKYRTYKNQTLKFIEQLKLLLKKADNYKGIKIDDCRNRLLGIEGNLSKLYFKSIQCFLPDEMKFQKRSRRPALDFFNAALNYLYGMTYSVVESGVFAKGLDPFVGFMHTDNYLKTSLVFDLIEPVRPLIDRMLIDLVIEKKISPEHFIIKQQGYWLGKKGKRVIIPGFNDYLYQRIKYGNKVRRLKDIIYSYSNDLGNIILNT